MRFKATDEQVAQMIANAVNASRPMGLGFFHYDPKPIPAEAFADDVKSGRVSLDYVQGRMVKVGVRRDGDAWVVQPDAPRHDYQSWAGTYRSARDLVMSAGGKPIETNE